MFSFPFSVLLDYAYPVVLSYAGPGGNLRVYLEGLAVCHDVQLYVQDHPFGQKAIADSNPSWKFYLRIIDRIQQSSSLTS